MRLEVSDDGTVTYRITRGSHLVAALAGVASMGWIGATLSLGMPGWAFEELVRKPSFDSIMEALFVVVFVPVGLLGLSVWTFLRGQNECILIDDSDLVLQNWRKARRLLPWEGIVAVLWTAHWWGIGLLHWLSLEVRGPKGPCRVVNIACCRSSGCREMQHLKDQVVRRCGFSETPSVTRLLPLARQRIWQRGERLDST